MHKAVVAALVAVPSLGLPAFATAQEMDGEWARGDGNAVVRIAPCGSDVCATNIWIKDTSEGEEVGDKLVMTLEPQGDGYSGTAYDAKRDQSYKMTVSVSADAMTTKGCIVGGLLCKSIEWTRR